MTYKYFSDAELSCQCGCGDSLMDDHFMRKLEAMREEAGFPFPLSSAKRCPEHNNRVSSTGLDGPHTTGQAVDIAVSRGEAYIVAELAFKYGMTGIGFKQHGSGRFVHVDDLHESPRPNIWSYK